MKKFLLFSAVLAFISCNHERAHCVVAVPMVPGQYGKMVEVDSFCVLSRAECLVWVDGEQFRIFAKDIVPIY